MKNFLIRLLLLFKPTPSPSSSTKKFLIVSTTGLGDTLWATPAIRTLQSTYPEAEIHVLTSRLGAEVLQNNPHIKELFILSTSLFFSLCSLLSPLKKKQFDTIFIFHSSQRLIFPFCALLGASKIVGTKGLNKDLDFILTDRLEKKEHHEIERRLEIIGVPKPEEQHLEFFVGQEDEAHVEEFLHSHHIAPSARLIGLHPGAQNLFKQWDPNRFIALGLKLKEKWECTIIISGNQKEAPLVAHIASKIPGSIPIAGTLPLGPFAALQKKMALFITNDTGPMHLSFAMNTPTIALFGPTDHKLCGPHQAEKARVIQKKKTCAPCLMKKCEDPFCLLQIGVDEVYNKALELIL